jgi:hypothetical protein
MDGACGIDTTDRLERNADDQVCVVRLTHVGGGKG